MSATRKKKSKKGKSNQNNGALDTILSETIISEVSSDALTKRLLKLHGVLKELQQDERPSGIEAVAAALVSRRVLEHHHKVL